MVLVGSAKKETLKVVTGVDLQRYQGKWFEIASTPARFQPKNGKNTTATYTLRPDSSVHVLNETWLDGKRVSIEGTAWKVDPNNEEAKLKVRFWVPPFLPIIPATGDYWVMHLDPEYRWALVGQPSRKYLWVLSRTPHLSEEVYSELLSHAEKEGYDVSKVQKTQHDEGGNPDKEGERKVENDNGKWWLKSAFGK